MKFLLAMPPGWEPESVIARRIGSFFCVHPDGLGPQFTLSHIPTGRAVKNGMCCRESANLLAKKLSALDVNWDFKLTRRKERPPLPKRVRAEFDAAKPASIVAEWACPIHSGQTSPDPQPKRPANKKADS